MAEFDEKYLEIGSYIFLPLCSCSLGGRLGDGTSRLFSKNGGWMMMTRPISWSYRGLVKKRLLFFSLPLLVCVLTYVYQSMNGSRMVSNFAAVVPVTVANRDVRSHLIDSKAVLPKNGNAPGRGNYPQIAVGRHAPGYNDHRFDTVF